jgi:hypothetical protein
VLEQALWDHGIRVQPARSRSAWASSRPQTADRQAGFAGVRRLDVTADVVYASPADGLAVLCGVAGVSMPRMKTQTWRGAGHLETVAFHGLAGGKMLARWYDKSVEAGSGRRGTIIRAEDQRRFPARDRRGVEELTTAYCRDKFQSRFLPLWRATKGITVGGPIVLASKLGELVREGQITYQTAEQIVGFAFLDAAGEYSASRWTAQRRRSAARELGLVLADDSLTEVEVDLHEVLEEIMETGAWDG